VSTSSVPTFGTDGIRGAAGIDLTPEVALALGRAAGRVLGGPSIVVGADTRLSCPMLVSAFCAGAWSVGVDTIDLGVAPTPAVASVAAQLGLPAAMVSASHNPFTDNGIKLFARGGLKLRPEMEAEVQSLYLDLVNGGHRAVSAAGPPSDQSRDEQAIGRSRPPGDHLDRWVDDVAASLGPARRTGSTAGPLSDFPLSDFKVVIDCAHGAGYRLGPAVFNRLGVSLTVIGAEPTGTNINHGVGSTHPEALQKAVIDSGADMGFAFDGDADRVLAVDGDGGLVDGDRVLALLALDWASRGKLANNTVVVTVMTNLGFHRAMAEAGIAVTSTPVGDKHVLAALDDHGYSLGGEQSGHVICRELATTGDGVLTAVQLLDVVARSGKSFTELAASAMDTVPQILKNVKLSKRDPEAAAKIGSEVEAVEQQFGADGRVVVRPSGTEPLLRIMVEHVDPTVAEEAVERLAQTARQRL